MERKSQVALRTALLNITEDSAVNPGGYPFESILSVFVVCGEKHVVGITVQQFDFGIRAQPFGPF
eukprot:m.115178 g.115178  ORF g.115178 m.115178 type:complete len:65 (+) comp13081_c0_seq2:71-265(+)